MKKILTILALMLIYVSVVEGQIKVGYTDFNKDTDKRIFESVMENMGEEYSYTHFNNIDELLQATLNHEIDVGMGGVSILADREYLYDFSVPYMNSGLKILIQNYDDEPSYIESMTSMVFVKDFWDSLTSMEVLVIGTWFLIFILVAAHIIYFSELKKDVIDDRYYIGIWQSIYFSIVTSSTVGYGDFTCKRVIGRISSILLIFVGVAFFANLAGQIAADRAVEVYEATSISDFNELANKTIATKEGLTSSFIELDRIGATVQPYSGANWHIEAVESLKEGKVDAIVYDAPLIDTIDRIDDGVKALPNLYFPQYYGFVLPDGSELKEDIDYYLLKYKESR